jgi:hypothetical protein
MLPLPKLNAGTTWCAGNEKPRDANASFGPARQESDRHSLWSRARFCSYRGEFLSSNLLELEQGLRPLLRRSKVLQGGDQVYGWGCNAEGQLGLPATDVVELPQLLEGTFPFTNHALHAYMMISRPLPVHLRIASTDTCDTQALSSGQTGIWRSVMPCLQIQMSMN